MSMINIKKQIIFKLKDQYVISLSDISIVKGQKGYFILNFWDQCSFEDINVLPIAFVPCENAKRLYELKKDNVILGDEKDICLI